MSLVEVNIQIILSFCHLCWLLNEGQTEDKSLIASLFLFLLGLGVGKSHLFGLNMSETLKNQNWISLRLFSESELKFCREGGNCPLSIAFLFCQRYRAIFKKISKFLTLQNDFMYHYLLRQKKPFSSINQYLKICFFFKLLGGLGGSHSEKFFFPNHN